MQFSEHYKIFFVNFYGYLTLYGKKTGVKESGVKASVVLLRQRFLHFQLTKIIVIDWTNWTTNNDADQGSC